MLGPGSVLGAAYISAQSLLRAMIAERSTTLLLRLTIDDRTIDTTPEHPFFVRDRGWTSNGELKPGDQLASLDSGWLTVQITQVLDCDATVYNVSIQDFHTDFVGEEFWG